MRRRLALACSLLLLGCPSPHHWRGAECAHEKGRAPDRLDLDTRAFVELTHDVATRQQSIALSWSEAFERLADELHLDRKVRAKQLVDTVRTEVQGLQKAACTIRYSRRWVDAGEPDDELRRLTHLDLEWMADCPPAAYEGQKSRLELLRVSGPKLAPLLEAATRYRALLPKGEAVAARRRTIPIAPSEEEKREWDCAARALGYMLDDMRAKIAVADALEAAYRGK